MKKVYIILVNYNAPYDTIECVQSILNQYYQNYQIIIVDNSENLKSCELMHLWVNNNFEILPKNKNYHNLLYPRKIKNVSLVDSEKYDTTANIIYHQTINRGFAAACNEGIKIAQKEDDYDYIWLLNNDTVVDEYALYNLVQGFEKYKNQNIGICGSKILFYDEPHIVQSLGRVQKSLYRLSHIAFETNDIYDDDFKVDEISGASMLLSKNYIRVIGFMPEEYFLYMEETDWNYKGKSKGYNFFTIVSSKIFHKESISTGGRYSFTNIYYNTRNKIHFLRKYSTNYIFILIIFIIYKSLDFFKFLIKGDFKPAKAVLKGLVDGIMKKYGK